MDVIIQRGKIFFETRAEPPNPARHQGKGVRRSLLEDVMLSVSVERWGDIIRGEGEQQGWKEASQ